MAMRFAWMCDFARRLERENIHLRTSLEEIERNCSLNGFAEDAPEDLAHINGLVTAALYPVQWAKVRIPVNGGDDPLTETCELDELRPYGSDETSGLFSPNVEISHDLNGGKKL